MSLLRPVIRRLVRRWIQAEIDRAVKEDLIPLIEIIVSDKLRSRRAATGIYVSTWGIRNGKPPSSSRIVGRS
jgi:hypothetical protein